MKGDADEKRANAISRESGLHGHLRKRGQRRRAAPVPVIDPNQDDGARGPSHLGTGEAADLNRQEEARRLAGSAPTTAHVAKENPAPR